MPLGRAALREQLGDVRCTGSPRPASFRCEPHPAAFVTIASTPAASNAAAVFARALEPLLAPAGVQRERAAAARPYGAADLEPVRGEHARRRAVHLAEEDALDAAGEQPDAGDLLARGRCLGGGAAYSRHGGASSRNARIGASFENRSATRMHARVRQDGEGDRPHAASRRGPRHLLLDLLAGQLDQTVVLHAGRARGHARHAAEAAVEVLGDRAVQLDRPVERRLHQPDPPARRVHLLVPELRRSGTSAGRSRSARSRESRVSSMRPA